MGQRVLVTRGLTQQFLMVHQAVRAHTEI